MAVGALSVHSDARERIEESRRSGRSGLCLAKKKEVAPAQMNRERRVCRYRNLDAGGAGVAGFVSDVAITQYACR
jgi:hypothetical protein